MPAAEKHFTLTWRMMRVTFYTLLIVYAFAVGQLHWAPPELIKPFMDFITLAAVGVLVWHLLYYRKA